MHFVRTFHLVCEVKKATTSIYGFLLQSISYSEEVQRWAGLRSACASLPECVCYSHLVLTGIAWVTLESMLAHSNDSVIFIKLFWKNKCFRLFQVMNSVGIIQTLQCDNCFYCVRHY